MPLKRPFQLLECNGSDRYEQSLLIQPRVQPSQVTRMYQMFKDYEPRLFNQPIGSWNIPRVQNIEDMFGFKTEFNQHLGFWNTSSLTYMTDSLARSVVLKV